MIELIINEDGETIYKKESDTLAFGTTGTNTFFLKGSCSLDDLIDVASNTLLFLHSCINKHLIEDYSLLEFIYDIISNIKLNINHSDQSILKCSNPNNLLKALQLSLDFYDETKHKLPDNYNFIGLDYDELLKQIGDDEDDEDI